MSDGQQLERSVLEGKERDELHAIADAMGLKPTSRSAKATLVTKILQAAGVEDTGDNGVKRTRATKAKANGAETPAATEKAEERTDDAIAEAPAAVEAPGEPTADEPPAPQRDNGGERQDQRPQQGQGQQGQQGQGGQQAQGGQRGDGQFGGNRNGLDRGGAYNGGAFGGWWDGGVLTEEDRRQLAREAGQFERDARDLRSGLRGSDIDPRELDEASRTLERLKDPRVYQNVAEIARMQSEVAEKLKRFEFALRRQVDGDAGSVALSGQDESPEGYKKLNEQYFRSLGKTTK